MKSFIHTETESSSELMYGLHTAYPYSRLLRRAWPNYENFACYQEKLADATFYKHLLTFVTKANKAGENESLDSIVIEMQAGLSRWTWYQTVGLTVYHPVIGQMVLLRQVMLWKESTDCICVINSDDV